METTLVTAHLLFGSLVLGILFLQSLLLLMQRRLGNDEQRLGVKQLQRRVQLVIFYPLLALAALLGFWQAGRLGILSSAKWLHWKLVLVLVLVGFGLLLDWQLSARRLNRPLILLVHISTLLAGGMILYLAHYRPF